MSTVGKGGREGGRAALQRIRIYSELVDERESEGERDSGTWLVEWARRGKHADIRTGEPVLVCLQKHNLHERLQD